MTKNRNLAAARKAKNDEFYTQLSDIEAELRHYKGHFDGKTVFCNCNDTPDRNFFKFFSLNFKEYGLKKLIGVGYDTKDGGVKYEYNGFREGENTPRDEDVVLTRLTGSGGFETDECLELLEDVDIVVTNPPFSLWRPFVKTLADYNKMFLILGNMNVIGYREIFPMIKNNCMWLGCSPRSMWFNVPSDQPLGKSVKEDKDGKKYMHVNSVWFTNISHKKRESSLELFKTYYDNKGDPRVVEYPEYDNYHAIEVSRTVNIPNDFDGVMGVPISFLDKHNPDQFEIIGVANRNDKGDHCSGLRHKIIY